MIKQHAFTSVVISFQHLDFIFTFISMQGGKKLERARDLFEQCLDGCPKKFTKGEYEAFTLEIND